VYLTGSAPSSLLARRELWRFRAVPTWFVAFAIAALLTVTTASQARAPESAAGKAVVQLLTLPQQAQETHRLILSGGPFPYDKDGTVFGNRERLLPANPRGFYREYTVKTPRAKTRGARRIVCGGKPPTQPEVCFYTEDHYASFRRITP